MAGSSFPGRRSFTVVEVAVVIVLAGLLAAVIVPVVTSGGEDTTRAKALSGVQEAMRRYQSDTGAYPTFSAVPAPRQNLAEPWIAGALPGAQSLPAFAGIDFNAVATRRSDSKRAVFVPDYIKKEPRHAGETAADGTQRWRVDKDGVVSIELDGRSF